MSSIAAEVEAEIAKCIYRGEEIIDPKVGIIEKIIDPKHDYEIEIIN